MKSVKVTYATKAPCGCKYWVEMIPGLRFGLLFLQTCKEPNSYCLESITSPVYSPGDFAELLSDIDCYFERSGNWVLPRP